MRFAALSAAALAFVSSALAQTADFDALTTPLKGEQVPAGKTYTVKWLPGTYTTGTATLTLLGGQDDKTLLDLGPIASGVSNAAGSYDWTVDESLGSDPTYGIKITLDSDPTIFQYSFPFQIAGTKSAESTSSGSSGYPVSSIQISSIPSSYPTTAPSPTKTLSLTSVTSAANTTVVSTVPSSAPVYSTSAYATLTPSSNVTVSATKAPSGFSSVTSARSSAAASSTSSAPSSIATGAAPRVAAGSFALLSGLAAFWVL